jgi:hypothetical protein
MYYRSAVRSGLREFAMELVFRKITRYILCLRGIDELR